MIIALTLFSPLNGQNKVVISGQLLDYDTHKPIPLSEIELFGINDYFDILIQQKQLTNRKGFFNFNIEYGRLKPVFFINAKKDNYIPLIPPYLFGIIKERYRRKIYHIFKLPEKNSIKKVYYLKKGGGIDVSIFINTSDGIHLLSKGKYLFTTVL